MSEARRRRTRHEIEAIQDRIAAALGEHQPQTVRHVFYVLCGKIPDLVPKTGSGYEVVQRECLKLRRQGAIPYSWITDGTRMRRGPQTFRDPQEAFAYWARSYRKNLWMETQAYVEIWCESDSVAGTIYDVIREYGLSLMTSRGFSSATYLHNAAAHLAEMDVPCWLYYLGDWDPSGKLIPEDIERKLNKFAKQDHHADVDIHFERLAITPELIETMNLPTKPAKTDSSHARGWQGGTVEIEALPVPVLRNMLERAILQHIDQRELGIMRRIEAEERNDLLTRAREGYVDGDSAGQ